MTANQQQNKAPISAKAVNTARWIAAATVSLIYPYAFNYYATLNFPQSAYGIYFAVAFFPALIGVAIAPVPSKFKFLLILLYAPILLVALFFQGGLLSCANNLGCL